MAIIKGSLTYGGDHTNLPVEEIVLEFSLPVFRYEQENKSFKRIERTKRAQFYRFKLNLSSTSQLCCCNIQFERVG